MLLIDDGSSTKIGTPNIAGATVSAEIIEEGKTNGGQFPYKYISVDTVDRLEDYCNVSATAKFKRSTIGKNFEGESVIELPQGGGYYYLREEVKLQIERLTRVCPHLILVSHVKEKLLNKGGLEVSSRDLSLTGKLSEIVCSMADAIGYMYRADDAKLMVSFKTYQGAIMGSRFPHLAGQEFEFDWTKIFLP